MYLLKTLDLFHFQARRMIQKSYTLIFLLTVQKNFQCHYSCFFLIFITCSIGTFPFCHCKREWVRGGLGGQFLKIWADFSQTFTLCYWIFLLIPCTKGKEWIKGDFDSNTGVYILHFPPPSGGREKNDVWGK